MTREEFLEQFILTRVSHKRTIEELLSDGNLAWNSIHNEH